MKYCFSHCCSDFTSLLSYRDVLFEFHLKFWNTTSICIPVLTGLTAQQKGTTARWYSNKTSLSSLKYNNIFKFSLHIVWVKGKPIACFEAVLENENYKDKLNFPSEK